MRDINAALTEKRTEVFSVRVSESLKIAARTCAELSGTSLNDHIATLIARSAAEQGQLGITASHGWDDLESAIKRSLCIARGMRATNGNRRIA